MRTVEKGNRYEHHFNSLLPMSSFPVRFVYTDSARMSVLRFRVSLYSHL